MKNTKESWISLHSLEPGQSIWLYIIEYTEECFPIVEKEYKVVAPVTDEKWVYLESVDSEKREERAINFFDHDVSAHSCDKIYIWLSEKNFRKAFNITKEYFMEKLVKSTREVSRLCGIFSNMEGWIDIFSCEDELSQIHYSDNRAYDVIKRGSNIDLTEVDEEVEE